MKLPVLTSKLSLKGKRVFVRVDWNVPLSGEFAGEDSLKLSRSLRTIAELVGREATVIVATHLGRPKKKDPKLSTKQLLSRVHLPKVHLQFLGDDLSTPNGLKSAQGTIEKAKPGSVFLLENVRFYPGEEKNDKKLAKAFASLADVFVNDAFASCHRVHASVVGVASLLPHYAGPSLVDEVAALEKLLGKPKRPYLAFIGGAKVSTKIDVITSLLKIADRVYIGGAMATAFLAAAKKNVGTSFLEKEGIPLAKKLLKEKKVVLPVDVLVAKKVAAGAKPHFVSIDEVPKKEAIGDIGPRTMLEWSMDIRKAKTIVWNGPMGVTEVPAFSYGSLVLARSIAARSKGACYGVVGGGDTLPVAIASGMTEWYDHLSTGGGAMLEFIAENGKLPGLTALFAKQK